MRGGGEGARVSCSVWCCRVCTFLSKQKPRRMWKGWVEFNPDLPPSAEVQHSDKPDRWLSFLLLMGDSGVRTFCTYSLDSPGFLAAFIKRE